MKNNISHSKFLIDALARRRDDQESMMRRRLQLAKLDTSFLQIPWKDRHGLIEKGHQALANKDHKSRLKEREAPFAKNKGIQYR